MVSVFLSPLMMSCYFWRTVEDCGRLWDSGTARLQGSKTARLRDWKTGRLQGWKPESLEACKPGSLQACKVGRMQGWSWGVEEHTTPHYSTRTSYVSAKVFKLPLWNECRPISVNFKLLFKEFPFHCDGRRAHRIKMAKSTCFHQPFYVLPFFYVLFSSLKKFCLLRSRFLSGLAQEVRLELFNIWKYILINYIMVSIWALLKSLFSLWKLSPYQR